jgi:HprK-related kinase A
VNGRTLDALPGAGLQLTIGPFLVHLRSDLPGVRRYLETLYADFPMRETVGGHFDVAIVGSRGPRRWIRPQANMIVNGRRPFLPLPADLAGALFEWSLNWCVGTQAHRWVAVHAAVVERGGRALVLSGLSGAGKSTLCAVLVQEGWRLFSDEFALIDPETGCLAPLPRPISLKNASMSLVRGRRPETIFGQEGTDIEGARFVHMKPPLESVRRAGDTAPVGTVIFPRWTKDHPTTVERVPKAHALVRLADQSFNYNYLGARGYEAIARLVRRVECYELEYSDVDDALARLGTLTQ